MNETKGMTGVTYLVKTFSQTLGGHQVGGYISAHFPEYGDPLSTMAAI